MRTRRAVVLVAWVALAGVIGWSAAMLQQTLAGDEGPTARFGRAQPDGGRIVASAEPGRLVPARRWPGACRFLTDEEIRAVLPDAKKIDVTPGSVSTRSIEAHIADPSWREDDVTTEGRCVWSTELPGEATNHKTRIWLRLVAVGDPALIAKYHKDQQVGRGAGFESGSPPGVEACYYSSLIDGHLVCRHQTVMFELGGSTTTTFGRADGYSFWRDRVLPAFATTVAAKIRSKA